MSKRGNAESAIVYLVLAIAIIGAIFVFLPTNNSTSMAIIPQQDQPGQYRLPMLDCQSQCMGRPVGEAMHSYPRNRVGGTALQACLQRCYDSSGVSQYPDFPTGQFAVEGAKEYGGIIRGVAIEGSRAFGGRAYEFPKQSCFTCSCLKQGITSATREAAERVCTENCGGTITSTLAGEC